MKPRLSALMLAFFVAAVSAQPFACVVDCDKPAVAAAPCHGESGQHGGASWRGVPHACSHDHISVVTATAAAAALRGVAGPTAGDVAVLAAGRRLLDERRAPAGSVHGPPGSRVAGLTLRTTVLRI